MHILMMIVSILSSIGALNWGLIGLFDFNLVTTLLDNTMLVNLIYTIIGICGLINIIFVFIDPDKKDI